MYWLVLLLLVGCANLNEPTKETYWADYVLSSRFIGEGELVPHELVLNGIFLNTGDKDIGVTPRLLCYFGEMKEKPDLVFDGQVGFGSYDWRSVEERWLPLTLYFHVVKPNEMVRVKIITPRFTGPKYGVYWKVVFVINGVER